MQRRTVVLVSFFASTMMPSVGTSQTLVRLDGQQAACMNSDGIYYEWKLAPFDNIRFVASGYEDGIEYSFYAVSDLGECGLLLQVNPIVVDAEGKFWWGYPWSINDIVRFESPCGLYLSATFEHEIERDGNVSVPDWQTLVPAVLFVGEKGEWNIQMGSLDFRPIKLADMQARAGER